MTLDFEKLITDLKSRISETGERLARLREDRRPHALKAVTGDRKARKAIANIDAEVASVAAEGETLAVALEEVQKQKAEHAAKAAAKERRQREIQARKLCRSILAKDSEIDEAAASLYRLLSEREEFIGQLSGTGVIYSGVINALRRRRNATGALLHAGLRQFVNFELGSPEARKPLQETDKCLRKPLMTAKGTEAPVGQATQKGSSA